MSENLPGQVGGPPAVLDVDRLLEPSVDFKTRRMIINGIKKQHEADGPYLVEKLAELREETSANAFMERLAIVESYAIPMRKNLDACAAAIQKQIDATPDDANRMTRLLRGFVDSVSKWGGVLKDLETLPKVAVTVEKQLNNYGDLRVGTAADKPVENVGELLASFEEQVGD